MRKRTLFAVCVAMLVMMTGCGNNTQPLGKGNDVDDMSNVFVTSDVSQTSKEKQASEPSIAVQTSTESISKIVEEQPVIKQESVIEKSKAEQQVDKPVSSQVSMQVESSVESYNIYEQLEQHEISVEESSEISVDELAEEFSEEIIEDSSEESEDVSVNELSAEISYTYESEYNSEIEESDFEDEDSEEELEDEEIWAITKHACTTYDGHELPASVYIKVVYNELDDEFCGIQWYDTTDRLDECHVEMFNVLTSDVPLILGTKKTVGVITQ